jgi:hypothetical protein
VAEPSINSVDGCRSTAKFSEELVKAGVMLAGEGHRPTSKGARSIRRSEADGNRRASFWLWQVKSREEAIEWVERAPFKSGEEIEIRQAFKAADFSPSDPTGQLRTKEKALGKTVQSRRP